MIVPTGLGFEVGGHAGDGNPAAKLLAAVCDELVVHPNVVNASDINEMPENVLYVEGSMLDRFLAGDIGLKRVWSNRILVAVNAPVRNETVNSVSAARATLGAEIEIVELETPLKLVARVKDGRATGSVLGWEELVEQVKVYSFDALAISTMIVVDNEVGLNYLRNGGANPWGGVEAIASKLISKALNKPVAHAPGEDNEWFKKFREVVDPRMAAEVVSTSYLHCVLKGLHRAPRASFMMKCDELTFRDIDVLITPAGCMGPPHKECMVRGIPMIVVMGNTPFGGVVRGIKYEKAPLFVNNYLEAAGMVAAMRAGISPESVRRPLLLPNVRCSLSD